MSIPLYDRFSTDYDRFVNWERRLAAELPFIEQQLARVGARRILDVACGTGRHAIALAQRGYQVVGADPSAAMIVQARQNAAAAAVEATFILAGFGELGTQVQHPVDALLCLGSSLPHIAAPNKLIPTLRDFAAVLRPGGLLIVQNRNFDRVLAQGDRWQPPQSHREGNTEWLFVRIYDFNPDGSLTFNLLTLRRQNGGNWQQEVDSTTLWPLRAQQLADALHAAGFGLVTMLGDVQGHPFDPENSPNLILITTRKDPKGRQDLLGSHEPLRE